MWWCNFQKKCYLLVQTWNCVTFTSFTHDEINTWMWHENYFILIYKINNLLIHPCIYLSNTCPNCVQQKWPQHLQSSDSRQVSAKPTTPCSTALTKNCLWWYLCLLLLLKVLSEKSSITWDILRGTWEHIAMHCWCKEFWSCLSWWSEHESQITFMFSSHLWFTVCQNKRVLAGRRTLLNWHGRSAAANVLPSWWNEFQNWFKKQPWDRS